MKSFLGIFVIVGMVVGVFFLNQVTRRPDGKSLIDIAGELPIEVELDQPQRRSIVHTVQAPGEVEAFSEVDISAEVVGKIIEMNVEEGDTVQKGDVLCKLDDAYYQAALRSSQANIAGYKAVMLAASNDEAAYARAQLEAAGATVEVRPLSREPARLGADGTDAGLLDTLERLAALHEQGVLTDEEFSAKKAEILEKLG